MSPHTVPSLDVTTPAVPQVGKYMLLVTLGQGGMADAWLAASEGPDGFRKLCVVKMLREDLLEDEAFTTMFRDEARLAAKLNHPNIVQTYEVDPTAPRPMLVMEYLEGQPLSRVRLRMKPESFPLAAKVRILSEVVEALAYAHDLTDFDGSPLGLVHRDATPQNVMVTYDGRAKLLDFGIAKSTSSAEVTAAGVIKGKLAYMPPEQALSLPIDARADIFSAGVMLWEFLCDKRISDGLTQTELMLQRTTPGQQRTVLEVKPDADPVLAAICEKAMAFEREDRYPTAHVMCMELEAWLSTNETSRRAWANELRQTFAADRLRIRTILEQRFSAMGIDKTLPRPAESSPTLDSGSTSGVSKVSAGAPEDVLLEETRLLSDKGKRVRVVALLVIGAALVAAVVLWRVRVAAPPSAVGLAPAAASATPKSDPEPNPRPSVVVTSEPAPVGGSASAAASGAPTAQASNAVPSRTRGGTPPTGAATRASTAPPSRAPGAGTRKGQPIDVEDPYAQ